MFLQRGSTVYKLNDDSVISKTELANQIYAIDLTELFHDSNTIIF